MATITAADVNKLRQTTGAGMMDCKEALVAANGDFEAAIDFLRKKGQKIANKRADRAATDGIVLAKTDGENAIMIMLNCETDFVARNQDFIDKANSIADKALATLPATLDELLALTLNNSTIAELTTDMTGKIGEKIELSNYVCIKAAKAAAYNHPGNRIGSVIGFNKDCSDELGKDITMQIAAMNPVSLDKNDVPKEVIEREIEIGKEQARNEGKPEEMLERIATGKLEKFYKENTLINQPFIKDQKISIQQLLQNNDKELAIVGFKRFGLGE